MQKGFQKVNADQSEKDGLNRRHDGRRELDYTKIILISGFESFWHDNDRSEETKGKDQKSIWQMKST